MDRTAPSATIKLADTNNVFSPDGDGSRDNFVFSLSGSEEDTWNLEIRDAQKNQKVVKSYSQNLPEALEWNGRDDQGRIVPDGDYAVYVFSVDSGNSFATTSDNFVWITKDFGSAGHGKGDFSPTGDG